MTRLSTGDFDYDAHGEGYARQRRADPRIASVVHAALGPARTVLNVGAGAGSYEPEDRHVVAIEPSPAMRAQRPAHLSPAIHGVAENLPVDDRSVDAAMATLTVHQWGDLEKGLAELVRVTRGPIVILTFDGDALDRLWLGEYAPELFAVERRRYPAIDRICAGLGGGCGVRPVPIPLDCTMGSARHSMVGRSSSWTRRCASHNRPGGLWSQRLRSGSLPRWPPIWPRAPGMRASAICGTSPGSRARSD